MGPALVLGALISVGLEECGASGQVVFFADVALVLIYCETVDLHRRSAGPSSDGKAQSEMRKRSTASAARWSRGIRVAILGRMLALVAEAMWRLWLLVIGATAVAVAFDLSGVAIIAWLAGLVALVGVIAVARWLFDWSFGGCGWLSDRALRRDALERRIDDAHSRGWEALKRRRFRQAAAAYREAAELGDADAMVNLANVLSDELGEPVAAEHWYRRAVDAGSAIAAENLGLMCTDQGRLDDARELFRLATERGSTGGYAGLAKLEVDRGEFERARVLLEIALMEHDVDAYAPLGEVLLLMDRAQEAEDRLRDGTDRGAPGAATVLAWLLEATAREDEAAALRGQIARDEAEGWPPTAP